jgi:oligopeptide/dipeptide ABC transporter ATP-binding protein
MLLEVADLYTEFAPNRRPSVQAVRGVSFAVDRGETLGIVGESGSGKSVTALSIARLLDAPGRTTKGSVILDGVDLLQLSEPKMRLIRGARIAFVFQDPMTALNPVLTIGQQMTETIRAHRKVSGHEARLAAMEWLERVHIPLPDRRINQFPYELSGGMRQRVMIAIAFSCKPEVLIADEPTTALDVTVQAQILNVMDELKRELGTAVLLITHDLSVVAERCDRVVVMYAGQVVEYATTEQLFKSPGHPYTKALLACIPDVWAKQDTTRLLLSLMGQPPRLVSGQIPVGCAFYARCVSHFDACLKIEPALVPVEQGHSGRCLLLEPQYANERQKVH